MGVNQVQQQAVGGQQVEVYLCQSDFQAKLLLQCFKGAAASRVKNLGIGSTDYNETILGGTEPNQNTRFENYFNRIQNLFMPQEESPLARSQFADRKQAANEDITNYVSEKLSLYHVAYSEAQMPFEFLRDSLVSGIYNQEVRRRLIENDPTTEQQLRTLATKLVAEERTKVKMDCSGSTSMDGLLATSLWRRIWSWGRIHASGQDTADKGSSTFRYLPQVWKSWTLGQGLQGQARPRPRRVWRSRPWWTSPGSETVWRSPCTEGAIFWFCTAEEMP